MKVRLPYPSDSYWPSGKKPELLIEDEDGLVTLYLDHEGDTAVLLAMTPEQAEELGNALVACAQEGLGR